MPFEATIQRAVEKLYEDERLRSNLTDAEAKIVLDWAAGWIEQQVNAAHDGAHAAQIAEEEGAFARQTVRAINALAATPGALHLSDALAAFDQRLTQPLPRAEVFALLVHFAPAWRALPASSAPVAPRQAKNKKLEAF